MPRDGSPLHDRLKTGRSPSIAQRAITRGRAASARGVPRQAPKSAVAQWKSSAAGWSARLPGSPPVQDQHRSTRLALTPPNPNPFEIACSIVIRRATLATRSIPSAAGSAFSRLSVGGATWSRSARIVKIASTPPAGAEQMSGRRFGRADGNPAVAPEHALDRLDLAEIADRRRCRMRVEMLDLARAHAGLRQRRLHRAAGAVAVFGTRGDVIGVRRRAIADDLGDRPGAAPQAAWSSSSITSTPAPSPITNPSRSRSNAARPAPAPR